MPFDECRNDGGGGNGGPDPHDHETMRAISIMIQQHTANLAERAGVCPSCTLNIVAINILGRDLIEADLAGIDVDKRKIEIGEDIDSVYSSMRNSKAFRAAKAAANILRGLFGED